MNKRIKIFLMAIIASFAINQYVNAERKLEEGWCRMEPRKDRHRQTDVSWSGRSEFKVELKNNTEDFYLNIRLVTYDADLKSKAETWSVAPGESISKKLSFYRWAELNVKVGLAEINEKLAKNDDAYSGIRVWSYMIEGNNVSKRLTKTATYSAEKMSELYSRFFPNVKNGFTITIDFDYRASDPALRSDGSAQGDLEIILGPESSKSEL